MPQTYGSTLISEKDKSLQTRPLPGGLSTKTDSPSGSKRKTRWSRTWSEFSTRPENQQQKGIPSHEHAGPEPGDRAEHGRAVFLFFQQRRAAGHAAAPAAHDNQTHPAKRILLKNPNPAAKLRAAILTHLYLSEAMQPWFYFSYMEAKNLAQPEQDLAVESELYTEKIFEDILRRDRPGADFQRAIPS